MIKVLFVCSGNICRSPMAEGVLQALAARNGIDDCIAVDSAGTNGYHIGEPPDRRAQATARARGYDLSEQRARRVAAVDFDTFDYIVGLDRGHMRQLGALCPPGREDRLHLLMAFAGDRGGDVPDPYYGGGNGFEHALDLIERGIAGLFSSIRESHPV
jgi:protein-tyrosine phosphatase